MKALISLTLLVASFSASAQDYIYPNVINWGTTAQVQVHNTSKSPQQCSGNVYLHMLNNTESHYYFDYIPAGGSSFRTIMPMNMQNPIRFTSHSIFCNKAN